MINRQRDQQATETCVPTSFTGRSVLLAGTAMLAMSMLATASAQQPSGGQATQPNQSQSQTPGNVADQLRAVEQSLRNAQQQISGGQPANFEQARVAVQAGRDVLGRVPQQAQGQEAFRTAQRELNEANQVLQGQQPNQQQASMQLREAADAVAALMRGMNGSAAAGAGGTAGNIVIREQASQVQVQQAQPRVTVQQPEPVITVIVPQPEIIVRQAPPQVRVEMPQPQVTVQVPEPQVRVVEAQPQVNVQPTQPQVNVQQAEPRVVVQQQGQPQIRFEQQGQAQVNVQQPGQAAGNEGVQQRNLQAQAPAVAAAQASAQPVAAGMPLARVQSLVGTNVVGSAGRDSGEVENLLIDRNGQVRAAVIEWGGFLGIGQNRAVVPIEQLRFGAANERVRMDLTREQLERLPRFDRNRLADYGREQGWGEGIRLHR